MRETVTYQKILREGCAVGLAEGRAEEARWIRKRPRGKRFGKRTAASRRSSTPSRTSTGWGLIERLLDVASWEVLHGEPANGHG